MFKYKFTFTIFILAFTFAFSQNGNNSFLTSPISFPNNQILSGLEAPLLTSPQNKTTELSLTFSFNWTGVVGATKYWFQISKDSLFDNIYDENKNAVELNIIMQTMDPSTKFYWRVAAKTNIETSPWSEVWSFTTRAALPLTPKLVSPENAVGLFDNNADLQWTKSSYSTSHQLQISKSIGFEQDSIILDINNIDTTFYKIRDNKLKPNSQYYWHIRGTNAKGVSPWSETRYFLTGGKTSVEDNISSQVSIAPNPSNEIFHIILPYDFNMIGIDLFDLNGRYIATYKNTNLNLENMPDGVYNIIIKYENHQISKQIIKK